MQGQVVPEETQCAPGMQTDSASSQAFPASGTTKTIASDLHMPTKDATTVNIPGLQVPLLEDK